MVSFLRKSRQVMHFFQVCFIALNLVLYTVIILYRATMMRPRSILTRRTTCLVRWERLLQSMWTEFSLVLPWPTRCYKILAAILSWTHCLLWTDLLNGKAPEWMTSRNLSQNLVRSSIKLNLNLKVYLF